MSPTEVAAVLLPLLNEGFLIGAAIALAVDPDPNPPVPVDSLAPEDPIPPDDSFPVARFNDEVEAAKSGCRTVSPVALGRDARPRERAEKSPADLGGSMLTSETEQARDGLGQI